MKLWKYSISLVPLLLALPGFGQKLETTLSLHPVSLSYALFVDDGHWLSLTLEQQISKSFSLVVTPTTYSHKYSAQSSGIFDSGSQIVHSHQAHALYFGP